MKTCVFPLVGGRLRVDDAVAIALERRPEGAFFLRARSTARLVRSHGNGDRPSSRRSHPLLEARHQTMIGTVPPSALQAAPVTYDARSEPRKTITAAISSGRASRPSGRPAPTFSASSLSPC